jgi:hypothetical protein
VPEQATGRFINIIAGIKMRHFTSEKDNGPLDKAVAQALEIKKTALPAPV